MGGVESKLHSKHKDSQISPEIIAEVKVFQQVVEEIINSTTEDDDQMSSYLKISLTELFSRHTVLTDQHRSLKEKVINDKVKGKETTSAALLGRLSYLEQEVGSLDEKITILEDENTKLKLEVPESESDVHESQSVSSQQDIEPAELAGNNLIIQLSGELATEESKVRMLKKDRDELLRLVYNIGNRVVSMEEELKASKKKLLISENVISHLKINRKIDEYKGLISEMEAMNKLKEDIWNDDVGKLKVKLESKCKSLSDLIEHLRAVKVEKNGLCTQLDTLQKEDYSKDDLIQELESRLNSLQAVHVGVRSLVDDVDKVNNELTLKVTDLKEMVKDNGKVPESELQEEVSLSVADISVRNDQITELNTMINQSMAEILISKCTHEAKQDTLTADFGRLNMELREKCQVIEALNKNMDSLKLEKDGVKAQLDTLHAEKCHQDNLIQEGLDILQIEHARELSSLDNAQKDANELKLKVAELEREVNMQKEVILDMAEEKREAIRQLSFSLEHYMSRYKELRQAFVSHKRHAVLSS